MKIQQLISETMNGYEDEGGDEDLHPEAKQWLESNGITNYDVIGPNTVDVNQDIHWGTIAPSVNQNGWIKINHVSGNFSWVTESRLMNSYARPYKDYFPKTVNGDCTIKFDSTGGSQYILASDLPKGSGSGTLSIECESVYECQLIPNVDFTATYANYNINVAILVKSSSGLDKLPSHWKGNQLWIIPELTEGFNFPSIIDGGLTIQSDLVNFDTLYKINQKIKQMNGDIYIQGNGPLPLVSLYRIKGVRSFDCLIWVKDEDDFIEGDTDISNKISRMFNNSKDKQLDAIEFQELLIDSGFKEWAK